MLAKLFLLISGSALAFGFGFSLANFIFQSAFAVGTNPVAKAVTHCANF